jgi:hypothetical protein
MAGVVDRVRRGSAGTTSASRSSMPFELVELTTPADAAMPLWCPWPLPAGWMVTGVGWAGDDRIGPRATAVAVSGPAPLQAGPADVVFVAEQLGVGLGASLGGLTGIDPGPGLRDAVTGTAPHAKVTAGGHPTPLWAVPAGPGRSMYVGEARAMWLYVIAWPSGAGYLLADGITLHDCVDSLPAELVFGADSGRLRPAQQRAGPQGTVHSNTSLIGSPRGRSATRREMGIDWREEFG